LHNAMRKYGLENFIIEIVAEYETKEEVKQAEIDLIKKVWEDGIPNYNLLAGGNGGFYCEDRDAWIEKLKLARKGGTPFKDHKHSEETKQKCADASRRRWEQYRSRNNDS
jgi:hypothetical protein